MGDGDKTQGWGAREDSPDQLQGVLDVDRHRRLLERVVDGGRHTLTSVALAVANDAAEDPVADRERSRTMYLTLYHEDVPVLAAADLVSYDTETGEVTATDRGHDVGEQLSDAA